jgi:hypothetical protein
MHSLTTSLVTYPVVMQATITLSRRIPHLRSRGGYLSAETGTEFSVSLLM